MTETILITGDVQNILCKKHTSKACNLQCVQERTLDLDNFPMFDEMYVEDPFMSVTFAAHGIVYASIFQ